ncbi:MAG: glycosyltransferase family 39 protein [Ardenticatenaceae bacterium]|nr:glycosyltransferase family 39 protein [Ardenticatenaceae bacterium]
MERPTLWSQFERKPWLVSLVIFVLALLPRLTAIGRFITPDELIWVYRSVQFQEALLQGKWVDTLTTGHPGVTTMWLGAAGIRAQLWLRPFSHATYQWITQLAYYNPDNIAAYGQLAHFLTAARLAVILVNSAGLVAVYGLAHRSFGRLAALLITTFLAFDPFVVGLSGLLHVDALMTTFTTLSLLALALWAQTNGRSYLLLCALTTALAILTKSPALLLLPLTALIFLFKAISPQFSSAPPNSSTQMNSEKIRGTFALLRDGFLWFVVCLVVLVFLFPALWVGPATAVQLITSNANRHIETALRPTFFLGQMAYEHGPLFYPIAILFRLGPLVFAGLILAAVRLLRPPKPQWSLATLIFILWPFLYTIAITFAEKKFDRYALPAMPALIILAAMGWAWLRPQRSPTLLLGLIAIQSIYLITTLPYPLASYNPLVGGSFIAQRVLPIGWGEAISAAGQWLSDQPGTAQQTAVSSLPPALAPFFSGQTLPLDEAVQADYRILTASSLQTDPAALTNAQQEGQLLHTIHFNGLDQAWIFTQPSAPRPSPLPPLPSPYSFDNRVQLLAAAADFTQEAVQVHLKWRLVQNGRYTLTLTLRDQNGNQWSQRSAPLLNETDFYPEHWSADETPQIRYTLAPPPAIPPGRYQVELSLFDAANAQLPLLTADNIFTGVIYKLPDITIPPPSNLAAVTALDLGTVVNQAWLNHSLILWGYQPLPPSLLSGSHATLDLIWQAVAPLPADVQIRLQLGDVVSELPLSRYPSGDWRVGQPIHEKYELLIPPNMPAGDYTLTIQPLLANGQLVDTAVSLTTLHIIATDRLFQLPATIATPLDVQFGSEIHLRGYDGPTLNDNTLHLTLYWQTDQPPADLYTVFVHILAADGRTITQADHWPGDRPTDSLAAHEVIADSYAIPLPPNAEPVQLAIGLYTASNGRRLPLNDSTSTPYPDNRLLIPLTP